MTATGALAYHRPMMRTRSSLGLALTSIAALLACNGGGGTATTGDSSGSTTDDSASATDTDTVSTTATTTDTTMTATTVADSSSSDGGCMGECAVDDDCLPGQSCLECICIGTPVGCAEWGEGEYANCVEGGNTVCGAANGGCVVDDPADATVGVCYFGGCTEKCDCPAPPAGFEEQVDCFNFLGDDALECAISCSGGGACPDGMFCFMGAICFWGDEPAGVPPYGDCVNDGGAQCEGGICISDNPADPTFGGCNPPCMAVGDCPPAPSGDAPPACVDITGDMNNECILDCSGGETCPDGMVCIEDFGLCAWPVVQEPVPGYGDCQNEDAMLVCVGEETCLDDATGGVCSAPCTAPTDCPAAPATGDAPVACGDLGGGADTCYLDCSGGQTCPDLMECVDDSYCHWTELSYMLEEDFEGGALPAEWTVTDVDGNTVNAMVNFIDAAWTVTDELQAGMNFAAYSTSWYTPAGMSDDWLITPQVTPSATSQLRWLATAPDQDFPDGYEVRVSTMSTDTADFTDVLLTVDAELGAFTARAVDLSAYAGMPIYVAFRNTSNDDFLLLVDNVRVSN